ncbi:P23-like cell envelope protein (plasmid) [Borrelia hermsii YBT]|uniref:BB0158 famile outer surface lipoprotein n=1 Tax=Borrelia hermsii TaxID=140 RepID=UPI0003E3B091|nr:hypothetical protein [Borrelia hermsii]AHH12989.1 P23-like cell envelope protein [Borrelia hermsii YBT]
MRNIIILLPIFITCHIQHDDNLRLQNQGKNSRHAYRLINKPKFNANVDTEEYQYQPAPMSISEGILDVCLSVVHWFWKRPICQITWAKTNPQNIIGPDTRPSSRLQGKLKYSYAVAPIQSHQEYTKYVMPLILFESVVSNIKVLSFKLTDYKNLNLDFREGSMQTIRNNVSNQLEKSIKALGYHSVFICGQLVASAPNGGKDLINAFANLYKDGQWSFMEGEITIHDDRINQTNTYTILLDSELFNTFLKSIIARHPGTLTANNQFRVPVN